jgi:hypothetical protein
MCVAFLILYRGFRVFNALFVERFRTEPRKIDTSVETYLGEIVLTFSRYRLINYVSAESKLT